MPTSDLMQPECPDCADWGFVWRADDSIDACWRCTRRAEVMYHTGVEEHREKDRRRAAA